MGTDQRPPPTAAAADIESSSFIHYSVLPNNTKDRWWNDPCLRRNVWHCAGLCAVTFMNGYDGSLLNGLQPMPEWQTFLGHPTGYRLGLIASAQYFPPILFSWVADILANRLGRRPVIWTGVIIVIAGALINGSAVNFGMYCGGRAVIGLGAALCLTTAPTLLQEVAHPRYRATIAGFYSCVYFGTLYMTGSYTWRLPCYLQVVGPIFVLIATSTCPESPRWLIHKGKREEALQILATHHANGSLDDALVQHEFREIKAALSEEYQNEVSYADFFRGKANRHRLLIIVTIAVGSNWVGNGIISYYLSPTLEQVGITSSVQVESINAGLQVWNLILACGGAMLAERLGRRFLWIFSNCGMFFSYIFAMALSGAYATTMNSTIGLAVIPFLFLFYGSYDVAWTPFQFAYPVEILRYSLRLKGMAIFLMVQNVALVVNTFVNPIALEAIGWKYYGVYVAILAGYIALSYFCFPETKSMTIEEISEIFEGSNPLEGAARLQRVANNDMKGPGGLGGSSMHVE